MMNPSGDPQLDEFGKLCCQSTMMTEPGMDTPSPVKRLDDEILRVGPWWLANFLVTSEDQAAKESLTEYLHTYWPQESKSVEQMITATHWRSARSGLENDFGGD